MKGSVRLIKQGIAKQSRALDETQSAKTLTRQRNRKIVSTVKTWITELEQRQRQNERAASGLLK